MAEFHKKRSVLLALIIVSPRAWQLTGFIMVPLYLEGNQHSTEHTLEFNLLTGTLRAWEFPGEGLQHGKRLPSEAFGQETLAERESTV